MEVAQISRTIARALGLSEDLAEAVALVHDLGHTPFGHAGEQALSRILEKSGGFNHNSQSLRVVDHLEDRYPNFRGLNLTFEVREGIVKHETDYDLPSAVAFDPKLKASLEGQLVNFADEIAYNAHDVDDGYFSGLLNWEILRQVGIVDRLFRESHESYSQLSEHKRHYHLIRLMINWSVTDLVENSARRLQDLGIRTLDDVRNCDENIIRPGEQAAGDGSELKAFLFKNLYRHPKLLANSRKVQQIVTDLYTAYSNNPKLLPEKYVRRLDQESRTEIVKDYVAGMTDRFAFLEHRRIYGDHSTSQL